MVCLKLGLPYEGSKGLGVLSKNWKQTFLSGPCIQGSCCCWC